MSDALLLVDPTVSRERLCSLVANGFQILHAFFRALFFVSASTWCGTNDGEDDYAKERKKKHDANPRGQRGARVLLFALFGIIVLAVIGPAPRGSTYEETRAKKRMENLKTVRDEAAKALATYGW